MPATHEVAGRDASAGFREQAVRLGAQGNLVGILSLPDGDRVDRPAIVVLNAGVLHRIGPHRLHVNLTRRLAGLGFPCLRLDLSGIGDSLAVSGSQSFRASAVADTGAAMSDLAAEQHGQRFVLVGLCSGADNALAAAAADDRVVGLVLLDPPAYRTRRSRARTLVRRIEALGPRETLRWVATVARRRGRAQLEAWRSRGDHASVEPGAPPSEGRETPPLAVYRQQLHALLARGVKVFVIFSGGLGDRYNHVDQVFEVLPELRGRIDHAYFPRANHVFTERLAQAALVNAVTAWVGHQFR